jgi:UDP-galactopyranose mutase
LKRLPVRFNYDDRYFNDLYQAIPVNGYTAVIENMLKHPAINLMLSRAVSQSDLLGCYSHIFWTGSIDSWFDYSLGRLPYRTLRFETFREVGDFQGNAVVNYCEASVPFTRITEHKHFTPWEVHEGTVCFKEFSSECKETDEPYYPLPLDGAQKLLAAYKEIAIENVTFAGRLGTYRYLDMHLVIREALDLARSFLQK